MAATTKIPRRPISLPITTSPATSLRFLSSSSSSSSFPTPDSNSNPSPEPSPQSPSPSPSAHSSFLSSIKATLRQSEQQINPQPQQHPRKPFYSGPKHPISPSNPQSIEEIRKNLNAFRSRTAPPPPDSRQPISFEKLYEQRNVPTTVESFDAIRKSLSNITVTPGANRNDKGDGLNGNVSRPNSGHSLKWGPAPNPSPTIFGGTYENLPSKIFQRELTANGDDDVSDESTRTEFVKNYEYDELGEKLRLLRPEKKGDKKNWFSLEELNERLAKLREMEERESESEASRNPAFRFLKGGLRILEKGNKDEIKRKMSKFRATLLKYESILCLYMFLPVFPDGICDLILSILDGVMLSL